VTILNRFVTQPAFVVAVGDLMFFKVVKSVFGEAFAGEDKQCRFFNLLAFL